jgi:hypothetical protein
MRFATASAACLTVVVLALSLPAPVAAVWLIYALSQLVDLMD